MQTCCPAFSLKLHEHASCAATATAGERAAHLRGGAHKRATSISSCELPVVAAPKRVHVASVRKSEVVIRSCSDVDDRRVL